MTYIPDLVDHFPKLRRGHGRGLGKTVPKGKDGVRHKSDCSSPGCVLLGGKTKHEDRAANIEDWETEHGIDLVSLVRSRRR